MMNNRGKRQKCQFYVDTCRKNFMWTKFLGRSTRMKQIQRVSVLLFTSDMVLLFLEEILYDCVQLQSNLYMLCGDEKKCNIYISESRLLQFC